MKNKVNKSKIRHEADNQELIRKLYQKVESLENKLTIATNLAKQESKLKNYCFLYLAKTKQYDEWARFKLTEQAKESINFIKSIL